MTSILVVEDDPGIRTALTRGLRERGHAVTVAESGLAALELVVRAEPDVVLLDLGLPDIDGLQVLAMLRGLGEIPVIVVTAQDDDGLVVRALDSGADDYVVKPFGLDQLAARMRAVLRRGGGPPTRAPSWSGGSRSTRVPARCTWTAGWWTCPARSSTCCSRSRPAPVR